MPFSHLRRLGATVAVIGSLMVAPGVDAGPRAPLDTNASATEQAVRIMAPAPAALGGRSLLVSDSAWLGMYLYGGGIDAVQGFEHTLALASCRRRVVTSCRNFDGYVPIPLLEELRNQPDDFSTLCERSAKPVIGDHRKPTWGRCSGRRLVRLAGASGGRDRGGDFEGVVFA